MKKAILGFVLFLTAFQNTRAQSPVLGAYPFTIIATAGGNAVVTPSVSPINTNSTVAYTNSNFKGLLQVNPVTGVVTITDARPAGTYIITVKAFNTVSTTIRNFTLTVNNASCSQGLFTGSGNGITGSLPYSVAIGDFNGDGKQDIATANYGNNTVSIRLGDGSGNFTGTTTIAVGINPQALAIGDFNGDGKQDIVVTNFVGFNVSILLGNGSGAFSVTGNVSLGSGTFPYSVVTGDFNGDGKEDFATANYGSNNLSILLGDGAGNFGGTTLVPVGDGPRSLATGDFNNDGKQDLATANYNSNTISVRLGDGLGGFSGTNNLAVGINPHSIAVGDFNGDGEQDLAAANFGNSSVSIRLSDGLGSFSGTTELAVGTNPRSIDIGDFNGDGKQDLAVANINSNSVSIRLGNGSGSFNGTDIIAVGNNPYSVAAGDFNGDGKQDIVTANTGTATFSTRLGSSNDMNVQGNNIGITDGDNTPSVADNTFFGNVASNLTHTFTIQNTGVVNLAVNSINLSGMDTTLFSIGSIGLPVSIPPGGSLNFPVSFIPTSVGLKTATVNINNDNCTKGVYDFAVQGMGIGVLPILGSYPATTISTAGGNSTVQPSASPINTQNITAYSSGNFEGLLQVDIATGVVTITNAHPAGVYTITVKSNGVSTATSSFILTVNNSSCSQGLFAAAGNIPVGNNPYAVAIGDFNADGMQDLATANYGNNTVSIRLGNGSGGFNGTTDIVTGPGPQAIAIGDFNGDGKGDLAVANSGTVTVSVFLGNGFGGFTGAGNVNAGVTPLSIATGDFNSDGKKDLAIANYGSNTISIRFGDGLGGFSGITNVITANGPRSVITGDFNADDKTDLAAADHDGNMISIRLGDGLGGFGPTINVATGANPYSLATGDFNSDGNPDLATANYTGNNVSVRLGDGAGDFGGTLDIPVGNGPGSLTIGDFNGDGKPDLATANHNSNTISIRLGDGLGGFTGTTTTDLMTGNNPYSLAIGDFNSDGKQDIAAVNGGSADVSIHMGGINEINVQGNNIIIADGANTPNAADNTDFGNVNSNLMRNFIIHNTGAVNLTINSITLSGTDGSLFTIGNIALPFSMAAGASMPFTITFIPTSAGLKTATVNIINDNCEKATYDFTIQGTGIVLVPTLGNYPATTIVTAGSNITVTPDALPANAQNITAYTSANFKGLLQVDTATGVLIITNAHPAGTYTITVKAYGISTAVSSFVLTIHHPACSQGNFGTTGNVNVAANPFSLVIGDFNADGKQDIATANYSANTVSIRLGDGFGNFNGTTNVNVGNQPYSIAIGDFNGDGKQDIATANHNSNNVSIRLGDGTGNFSGNTDVNVTTLPTSLVVGDFNGDGKQDLAVAGIGSNNVSIRLGDGAGNFSAIAGVTVASALFSIALGDFNNDGNTDLVTANYNTANAAIFLGNGSGGFIETTEMPVGINPYSIAVGDFNGDGNEDLATANYNDNNVSVLLGNGVGFLTIAATVPVGNGPGSLATGDFNGDGKLDFATANYLSNTVSIRLGNGAGDFTGSLNMIVGTGPESLATGDFNADGRQDIAVANNGSNNVAVRLGLTSNREINVQGNGINIADADNTPNTTDNTDFGTANNVTHTFNIQNTATGNLVINNITISGVNAALFTVSGISLPATVTGGGSIGFSITFMPLSTGLKTATVNINNDDCDEGDFDFAVQGTFACQPVTVSFTGLAASYCSNTPEVNLAGSQAIGAVFTGAGIIDNGNGTAIFDPLTAGAGLHIIQYVYTDGFGCIHSTSQSVTVHAIPVVGFSGLGVSCCIDAPAVILNGFPAGGVFSGQGVSGNVFIPSMAGVGPHTITYSYTDLNGCTNSALQAVTVNALPVVNFGGLAVSYCQDATAIILTGSPAAGIFNGPGINGNLFTASMAGAGIHTITYSYTDPNGCTNSLSQTVTVNALPVVNFTGLGSSYCADAPAVILTGSPAGGIFSGPGVSGNVFTPFLAGAGGSYMVTYSYADPDGCTNSTSQAVTVHALPVVSFSGLAANYFINDAAVTLTGNPFPNGIFFGPGITATANGTAIFDPAMAGAGIHSITYSFTDINGCSNTTTQQVSVTNAIVVNLKLYLQGYYAGSGTMQPVLNNQAVPLSLAIETDSITVELYDPATFALVDAKQAVLLTDGIVSQAFTRPGGSYYIAIRHRNSLQTWTADPVICTTTTPLYDFSTAAGKAFGDNQVEVEPGVWAFYTGDLNQDEFIDGNDFPQYDGESASGGLFDGTYTTTDMNGDGFVDGNDFPVYDANSSNGLSSIHP